MDIELIDTDALIAELMTRYDHAIFYGTTLSVDATMMHDRWQYKGNARMCRGLALDMMDRLKDVLHVKEKT